MRRARRQKAAARPHCARACTRSACCPAHASHAAAAHSDGRGARSWWGACGGGGEAGDPAAARRAGLRVCPAAARAGLRSDGAAAARALGEIEILGEIESRD
eukprot:scaffold69976_cov53-Phaeocystis_antarctica.AAC.1